MINRSLLGSQEYFDSFIELKRRMEEKHLKDAMLKVGKKSGGGGPDTEDLQSSRSKRSAFTSSNFRSTYKKSDKIRNFNNISQAEFEFMCEQAMARVKMNQS